MTFLKMSKKEVDRYEIIKRLIRKEIKGPRAANLLRLSPRQVRRLKARVKQAGPKALVHGNRGKPSNRQMPLAKRRRIITLLHKHYHDFGPTLASEKLAQRHEIKCNSETIRQIMTAEQLWRPKVRKKVTHHSWRARRDCYGELEQFDGSYEYWFEDRAPKGCLLASIDDATGKITGLEFAAHEGVAPVFAFWQGYLRAHGASPGPFILTNSALTR